MRNILGRVVNYVGFRVIVLNAEVFEAWNLFLGMVWMLRLVRDESDILI